MADIEPLTRIAFEEGSKTGRKGKGNLFMIPAGNGGLYKDSCAYDGNVNSIYTLSINAVSETGAQPRYGENCTGVIASTYSSGTYPEKYMVTVRPGGNCTNAFTGTSSSVSVAGGAMAILLQSNPNLGWRDVQHIVIRGVRPHNELVKNVEWQQNGMGRWFSRSFGYGLMDVGKMVELAQTWTNVPEQKKCHRSRTELRHIIQRGEIFEDTIEIKDCNGLKYLEHVQIEFSARIKKRGDVEVYLTSPMGTRSMLLQSRPSDYSPEGFRNLQVLDMEHWGENAEGEWKLEVTNVGNEESLLTGPLQFRGWTLTLYGTSTEVK